MPTKLQLSTGGVATYTYDAVGVKRKVEHQGAGENKTTDYCGNVIYENGTLSKILTEEGYITLSGTTPTYHYYLKDHLGNNRVVLNQNGTAVEQMNHYYPFGGLFDQTSETLQAYKYNGKELDRTYGIDLYDYSARFMDGAVGRFTTMDPLSEKYYSVSPYGYVMNNPMKFVDPDGRFVGTIVGTIVGGVKGAYDAHKDGRDVWAGAAEGLVAGAITGAAIDVAVAATAATGGGALLVIGAGVAAGSIGGAAGAVAGDVTGQIVTDINDKKGLGTAIENVSTENFANKATSGAISGAVGGLTGGAVGVLGNAAKASTQAVQQTMSKNISSTATTLTTQGASKETVNATTSAITKGMSTVGANTTNSMLKTEATVSTVTETFSKYLEDKLKNK